MRVSTLFTTLLTVAAAQAAVVTARTDIHDLASFHAAPHADQKTFLLQLKPAELKLSDAELATIAQEPRVAKKLNGRQLTNDDVRTWLVRWDKKHGKQ